MMINKPWVSGVVIALVSIILFQASAFAAVKPNVLFIITDPKYRDILLQHRDLLAQFGKEHNDALVASLLADKVKPVPFMDSGPAKARPAKKVKKPPQ